MILDQYIPELQIRFGLTPAGARLAVRLATGHTLQASGADPRHLLRNRAHHAQAHIPKNRNPSPDRAGRPHPDHHRICKDVKKSMAIKWIFVRCRMKIDRPEFNTDDWRAVVKGMQTYADTKVVSKKNVVRSGHSNTRCWGTD
jgi:hypothetical protein